MVKQAFRVFYGIIAWNGHAKVKRPSSSALFQRVLIGREYFAYSNVPKPASISAPKELKNGDDSQ